MTGPVNDFPVTAPPLRAPVWLDQFWADLTFLHWAVHPEQVAPLFPAGTRPDVFDGLTYVALVPFMMRDSRFGTAIPLPYFGTFAETNIRLYSIDDQGRHGVLFRSLETARLAVVPVTRTVLGVPYTWSKMTVTRTGARVDYRSVRRWPHRGLRSALTVTVGERVDPSPLEVWLTARWGAHTRKGGRTWWVPNEHGPWPLYAAQVSDLQDDLVAAAGVGPVGDRLRPLFSPGVRSRFGRPAPVD
ncbi:MAG: DUF2071 domain-containing protein [Mycobacterium sp.]